jgi:hypothetical protein
MLKWFAYIALVIVLAPFSLAAEIKSNRFNVITNTLGSNFLFKKVLTDTSTTKNKKTDQDDKKKVKEVTRAKKQPKPEKVESTDNTAAVKPKPRPKRQRRPEGLERPPEIPRRNGN